MKLPRHGRETRVSYPRYPGSEGQGMRTFFIVILGVVSGAVLGYAVAILGYILYIEVTGTHDRDGGGAMGAAFLIGPILAVFGGLIGALAALGVRSSRQARQEEGTLPASTPRSRRWRRILIGCAAALVTNLAIGLAFVLFPPGPFSSYTLALVVSSLPIVVAGAVGLLAAVWVGR